MSANQRIRQFMLGLGLATSGISGAIAGDCVRPIGTEMNCQPNVATFGHWQTHWRRWPGTIEQATAVEPRRDAFTLPTHRLPDAVHEADPPHSSWERPTAPPLKDDKSLPKLPGMGLPDRIYPGDSGGDSPRLKSDDPKKSIGPAPATKPTSRMESRDERKADVANNRRDPIFQDVTALNDGRHVVPAGLETDIGVPAPKVISMPLGSRNEGAVADSAKDKGSEGGRNATESAFRFKPNPLRANPRQD